MEVTGESEPPSRCGQSSLEDLWGEGGVAGPVVAPLRVQTTGPRGGFDLAPPRAHEPQGRREAEAGKGKTSWSSRSHSRRGARGEWKPRKPLALHLTPQLRSSSPQSLRDLSGTNLPKDRHLSERGSLSSRPRPEPAGAATAAPIRPWHSRGPRGRPGKTAPKIEALGDRRSPWPPVPGAAGGAAALPFGVLGAGAGWGGARAGADPVSVGGAARTPRPLGPSAPGPGPTPGSSERDVTHPAPEHVFG